MSIKPILFNTEMVQAMIDQKPDVMSYPIWMTKVELNED